MSELSEAIGTSPTNLAKTCKAFNIPVPPRGYWRKVETGSSISVTALPETENDANLPYEVDEVQLRSRADSLSLAGGRLVRTPENGRSEATTSEGNQQDVALELTAEDAAPGQADRVTERPSEDRSSTSAIDDDPSAYLLHLGDQHQKLAMALSLFAEIQRLSRNCDPATSAVLALWLARAKEGMLVASPAHEVIAVCRRVAAGTEKPKWWL